jgi:hypothetical protein
VSADHQRDRSLVPCHKLCIKFLRYSMHTADVGTSCGGWKHLLVCERSFVSASRRGGESANSDIMAAIVAGENNLNHFAVSINCGGDWHDWFVGSSRGRSYQSASRVPTLSSPIRTPTRILATRHTATRPASHLTSRSDTETAFGTGFEIETRLA